VQRGPQGSYVYVAENGKATMRPVTTGLTEDSQIEVTSGLAAGEMVVTDGQDKLQNGAKVDVRQVGTGGAGQQ
jgi:multidrug efflux system membrane fusion protein